MKVKIGPYRSWVGPYQIAEKILFWMDKNEDERVHKFGDWLAGKKDDSWLIKLCYWIDNKKERKISVKIHDYDVWGMDHTLALIILPMLQKLKVVKHGAPLVDDEDVPDDLKSTSAPSKVNEWDIDDNHFKRWDWVLDEMIFAFEKKLEDNWDDEFWTGEFGKLDFEETEEEGLNPVTKKTEKLFTLKNNNSTLKCDWDGRKKVQDRITNGYRLFGKYYESLWD
jgi:hypothetical protein